MLWLCTSLAPSDTLGHCRDDRPDQLLHCMGSTLIIPHMSFQSVWPTHKHPRAINSCTFLVDIMDHLLTQEYQRVSDIKLIRASRAWGFNYQYRKSQKSLDQKFRMHGRIAQKFCIIYLPPIFTYTAVVWITKRWNGNKYSTALVDPSQIL